MSFAISHQVESSSSSESPQPSRQFSISELQQATKNFDESFVIGRGGFGKVYKGTLTHGTNLLTAAIKRLDSTSNQGASEFWAEVKMLSNLRHRHLVSLIGYCNDWQEMILVYEYMSHGTLEDHLHKRATSLTWMRRLQICLGAARGLDYLHTGARIIHRDVKPSNILLDKSWEAKISDFGLSKIIPINQPSAYVSTEVKGTIGYLDPDYYISGRLTRKSDVFSFGVMLFEVMCGRKAVDTSLDSEDWGLVRWAQDSIKQGRMKQIIDSNIRGRVSSKCVKEFTQLAERCLNSYPKHRPTMAQVVAGLEYMLALQEKAKNTLKPVGMTIFGKKIPMFAFPSNGESSDVVLNLKSLRYQLDAIEGENHVFRQFDFDTIQVATENFPDANIVFRSHFCMMYKGRLQNGQGIAVAEILSYRSIEYLMREVSILVKCEHEHIIKLLGYCIEETKVFLIYEFASNGSLFDLLYDSTCTQLEWNKLYKIILGVARALVYLHNHAPIRIMYGNLQPRNILFDESFDPKLSNFRYARAINETDCVHVDRIRGIIAAPEYRKKGVLSTKADVYNFGVIILKTMCGHSSTKYIETVQRNWLEGMLLNMINPKIDVDSSFVTRFLEIALLCVQIDPGERPTMEEVVKMLLDSSYLALRVSKMRAMFTRKPLDNISATVHKYTTDEGENQLVPVSISAPVHKYNTDEGENQLVPVSVLISNRESSDGVLNLKSLRNHLDTIEGENHIFRQFDFDTIQVATENFNAYNVFERYIATENFSYAKKVSQHDSNTIPNGTESIMDNFKAMLPKAEYIPCSNVNEISQSQFVSIYKGRLQNGQYIAVAKLYSYYIENNMREASILVKCEHEHIIKVLGYCIEDTKAFLIYEFASTRSLHNLLHDPTYTQLEWNKLYKIILGVARALDYLHNHAPIRTIHGSLGQQNILLDESSDPKLSDFRFAREINETDCVRVAIIPGIEPPECSTKGVLSTKADVYKFGVLVLEIMTGHQMFTYSSTEYIETVKKKWLEGTLLNIVDPRIDVDSTFLTRFLEIGLLCVQTEPGDRPTMEEVVDMLPGNSYLALRVSKMRAMFTRER